jgi:hypothetical protein
MSKERELLKKLLDAITELDYRQGLDPLTCEIEELLAEPEQEPVAWIIETEIEGKLNTWICTDKKHYMDASDGKESIPLYTSPQKLKPLSDEELSTLATDDLYDCTYTTSVFAYKEYARKIEKAHGIGVDNE